MAITAFRPFGRTRVKLAPLLFGTLTPGGRTDRETSWRIVDRAIDAGINVLDTANVYSRGLSEEITGEALRRNGKRDAVFLASKVHLPMHDTDPNLRGSSRRHVVSQAEASLKRLGTDPLDLYQIHRPEPDTAIDETLRALDDLVRSGKVRYIGASTFAGWQLVEALWAAKELGLNRFVSEQPPYNLLDRRVERELIPAAQTFGLAVIPWSPLAGGLLTGKYRRGEAPPEDARYSSPNPAQERRLVKGIYDVGREPVGPGARQGRARVAARDGVGGAAAGRHRADHRTAHRGATRGRTGGVGPGSDSGRPGADRRHRSSGDARVALLRGAVRREHLSMVNHMHSLCLWN